MITLISKIKQTIPADFKQVFITVHSKTNPSECLHVCTSLFALDQIPSSFLSKDHFIQADRLKNGMIIDWVEIDLNDIIID